MRRLVSCSKESKNSFLRPIENRVPVPAASTLLLPCQPRLLASDRRSRSTRAFSSPDTTHGQNSLAVETCGQRLTDNRCFQFRSAEAGRRGTPRHNQTNARQMPVSRLVVFPPLTPAGCQSACLFAARRGTQSSANRLSAGTPGATRPIRSRLNHSAQADAAHSVQCDRDVRTSGLQPRWNPCLPKCRPRQDCERRALLRLQV